MLDSELMKAIILGVVQGITEFLPISSDGHLVVVNALLKKLWPQTSHGGISDLHFDVVLHIGTLLAIIVVYWHDLWGLRRSPKLCWLIVLATLPAVFVGLVVKKQIEQVFTDPLIAGLGLLVTAGFLAFAHLCTPGQKTLAELTVRDSLWIGLAQSLAILPGVSRSGSTISTTLLLGVRRDLSATFSFLMAVPVVGGAIVLVLKDLWEQPQPIARPDALLVGTVVSFGVGLVALRWLLRILSRGGLRGFAIYCAVAGHLVIAWQLWETWRRG